MTKTQLLNTFRKGFIQTLINLKEAQMNGDNIETIVEEALDKFLDLVFVNSGLKVVNGVVGIPNVINSEQHVKNLYSSMMELYSKLTETCPDIDSDKHIESVERVVVNALRKFMKEQFNQELYRD